MAARAVFDGYEINLGHLALFPHGKGGCCCRQQLAVHAFDLERKVLNDGYGDIWVLGNLQSE